MITRRTLSLLLLSLFFSGLTSNAQVITPQQAADVARNFLIQKTRELPSDDGRTFEISRQLTHTAGDQILYYVFNFVDNGFVITTAEKRFYPVLAWSPQGTFTLDAIPENCRSWLQWYEDQVANSEKYPENYFDGMADEWDKYLLPETMDTGFDDISGVAPLLTSKWDQGKFYNTMCPADANGISGHAPVGCVATAMAMVMHYYRFPAQGSGSHSYIPPYNGGVYGEQFADFGNTIYRWDEMVDQCFTWNDAVAELGYHCGVAVNMKYSPGSSGAGTLGVPDALINYFNYLPSAELINRVGYGSYEDWFQLLAGQLDNRQPVIYRSSGNMIGHAYVCDGYHDSTHFHFNWGWSGNHNGYYYIDELIPGGIELSHGQGGVFYVYPDTTVFDYPPFCQGEKLHASSIGSVADGSGPLSYQPGASCSWLIKPDDPEMTNIMLDFSLFDLSTGNDFLHVYAGESNTAPLLGTFTGNDLPPQIRSGQPTLFLVLESNDTVGGRGFHANYHTYGLPFCEGLTVINAPAGAFDDGSGFLDYATNHDCRWLLAPEVPVYDSVEKILLQFKRFEMAAGDTLFVYDGMDETAPLLASLTGNALPPDIVSTENLMLLNFKTNESDTAAGWEIKYHPVPPVYCSDTTFLTAPQGFIEDGSGDKHYRPNTSCHWQLHIPEAEFITLEFTKLDLEINYDYILVRDLNQPQIPPKRFTGNIIPAPVTLNSDKILISFFTDYVNNQFGWELNYHVSAESVTEIHQPLFTLFPNPVTNHLIIRSDSGKSTRFNYSVFDLLGNEMRSGRSDMPETSVDTGTLPPGIYLIEIKLNDHIFLQKIVKL